MCGECKQATCSNCGEEYEKAKGRKGLCGKCTSWMRNHSTPRPVGYKRSPDFCVNCGEPRTKGWGGKGLCKNCYQFWRNNGRHRTPADMIRKRGEPPPVCRRCGIRSAEHVAKQGLCKICYDYQLRNGKPRPRWRDAEKCKNCGKPRTDEPRKFYKGRCDRCNEYLRKRGVERPERFWGMGKYGWCQCSQPAMHKATVRIHNHLEEMPLCDECHAEYQRQVRWYGDGKPTGNLQEGKRIISGND